MRVVPSARTVALIQDKFAQKEHFAAKGVPLAPFCALRSERDVADAAARFGFPLVVKSRRLAYDGRGNATARSAEELPAAIAALGGLGCAPPRHPPVRTARSDAARAVGTARSCTRRRGRPSWLNWRSWSSAPRRGSS